MKNSETSHFSAEEFVENLLNEGGKSVCDETSEFFRNVDLPPYYDEKLYKRGQKFFRENMYALLFNQILAAIVVIARSDTLNVLIMTNMSSSDVSAYRRYMATLFHMITWYQSDFGPASKIFASIADVKRQHNAASKRSIQKLKYRIDQKGMALTQFGYVGFVLTRTKMIGIHNPKEEDLKAFIHMWRVLGYMLGIEDRFNICRESVMETKQICNLLIQKVFFPVLRNPAKPLVEMAQYFINGMTAVIPSLEYHFAMTYIQMLLENVEDYKELENTNYNVGLMVKLKLYITSITLYSLKFKICRLFHNYWAMLRFWYLRVFPISEYIKYGFKNGHVDFDKVLDGVKIKNKLN